MSLSTQTSTNAQRFGPPQLNSLVERGAPVHRSTAPSCQQHRPPPKLTTTHSPPRSPVLSLCPIPEVCGAIKVNALTLKTENAVK
jgi:hypothetical protein